MRVVSLLPAATEIVAALGGAGSLVGISHECDYPASVLRLPRVTATPVDPGASGHDIDAEVRRLHAAGTPVIGVNAEAITRLAPDLIITQDLCEVCAVAQGEVRRLAAVLRPAPAVLALSGRTLEGIWRDIGAVARALDLEPDGDELIAGLRSRLGRLQARQRKGRSRVVCVEWLDPLYLAGHWVPQLVEAAGGYDVGAAAGSHSARREWAELQELSPDLFVIMLCGFGVERTMRELAGARQEVHAILHDKTTWVLDGNAYTSRSGPRVVDGAERLWEAFQGRQTSGMVRWERHGR
jgi:iron complex transport system substrate-binding protein